MYIKYNQSSLFKFDIFYINYLWFHNHNHITTISKKERT